MCIIWNNLNPNTQKNHNILSGSLTLQTFPWPQVAIRVKNLLRIQTQLQSNLYKTTTLGTTQKCSSWVGGRLIKHLYKATTNQI